MTVPASTNVEAMTIDDHLAGFELAGLSGASADSDSATRRRLLVAAVRLFAERGYEACSMRELAAEVGVKAPAIYNHFASKTDVLIFAVDYALSDFLNTVLTGIDEFPQSVQLYELLRRHALYKTADVALARARDRLVDADFLRRVLPPTEFERFARALAGYRAIVREKLLLARPEIVDDRAVSLTVVVSALIEICDQVSSWYRPSGSLSGAEVADQVVVVAHRIVGGDSRTDR